MVTLFQRHPNDNKLNPEISGLGFFCGKSGMPEIVVNLLRGLELSLWEAGERLKEIIEMMWHRPSVKADPLKMVISTLSMKWLSTMPW